MKFFGIESFLVEGSSFNSSLKDSPYDRLPLGSKNLVRKEIWDLSKNSAGISIRFITNSSFIAVKWLLLNDFTMHHMPNTGIKGIISSYLSDKKVIIKSINNKNSFVSQLGSRNYVRNKFGISANKIFKTIMNGKYKNWH